MYRCAGVSSKNNLMILYLINSVIAKSFYTLVCCGWAYGSTLRL